MALASSVSTQNVQWSLATATFASYGLGASSIAIAHLEQHGVLIEAGPLERNAGSRGTASHVYFRDADGSLLEFVSYEKEKPDPQLG